MSRYDVKGLGELKHRIALVRQTRAPDPDFGFTAQTEPVADLWAKYEQAARVGRLDDTTTEAVGGGAARPTHAFTVRFRGNLAGTPDVTLRILFRGQTFKIVSTEERDDRNRFITLFCALEEVIP